MRYSEIEGLLSTIELDAIEELEGCGWEILTETKIEDTHKKDGGRIRTFTLSGRYDVALVLKKVNDKRPMTVPEAPKEIEIEEDDPGLQLPDAPFEPPETAHETLGEDQEEPNFWIDTQNWKMMNRDRFYDLVIGEGLKDLKAAPDEIQEAVHKKFNKFFDPGDWPLK